MKDVFPIKSVKFNPPQTLFVEFEDGLFGEADVSSLDWNYNWEFVSVAPSGTDIEFKYSYATKEGCDSATLRYLVDCEYARKIDADSEHFHKTRTWGSKYWYAAHNLMYVQFKEDNLDFIPCWENIHLIFAQNEDEAFKKAEELGKEAEGDSNGSFKWAGMPATWVFAGVRKLTYCNNSQERPDDKTEITYLEYLLPSKKAIQNIIEGKHTNVVLHDKYADEDQEIVYQEIENINDVLDCKEVPTIYRDSDGKYHKIDGPAYESPDGYKVWYIHGKKHRVDGPAVEHPNGYKAWYINDKFIKRENY